ncbi:DUF6705 family protein [Elizabethkingia miricola]|uniref:DUF6705 family protein n=1 Tax=Elizabethkingia miricola TaxID=172045 RepID=UPI0009CD61C8|nr:DUF6705 family protein [Elizabethkingia miricola]OPC37805.1 hypothetical protein BAX99_03300 [Elizabethkingia miricola]
MKKLILTIAIIFFGSYINAQTISLSNAPYKIPIGSYLKDIDNTLPLFTGTWTANFEGKQVILNISDKVENFPIQLATTNYYSDVLFMKYTINDSNNNQLVSTINKTLSDVNIISTFTSSDKKRIGFVYKGEACGIGRGLIYLTLIDATHIKWEYKSTGGIIDPNKCAGYSPDIKSYIPRSLDLIFTKQ